MRIGVNDLSFLYPFSSLAEADAALLKYVSVCAKIQQNARDKVYPNLEEHPFITGPCFDCAFELVQGYTLQKLVKRMENQEYATFFLSVLLNSNTIEMPSDMFLLDGKESAICAYASENGGMVASLESHEMFRENKLCGELKGNPYVLKNIASDMHLVIYTDFLGKKIYIPNREKHKKDRENAYAPNRSGSRMDLTDKDAQELLNRSIRIGKRFYGKKNGNYYTFPCTRENIYHGYQSNDLEQYIKMQVDRVFPNDK